MRVPSARLVEQRVHSTTRTLPPQVPGWPVVGNLPDFARDVLAFCVRNYQTYGPVYRIRLLNREYWVLAGLEANLFLARDGDRCLSSRSLRPMGAELGAPDYFLLAQDGAWHRQLRRAHAPGYKHEVYERQIPRMVTMTKAHIRERWRPRTSVPVVDEVQRMACEQVGQAVLGQTSKEIFEDVRLVFAMAIRTSSIPLVPSIFTKWPPYVRAKKRVWAYMRRLVEMERARLARGEEPSSTFAAELLAFRDADGRPIPDLALAKSFAGVFFSSLDTLASTLSFMLYAAYKHPAILQRVREEVALLFSRPLETIDRYVLKECQALYGLALETMRMYPVVPVTPRIVLEPFEIEGVTIPAGVEVMFATGVTHMLPEFFPNPDVFDIDRYTPERAEHRRSGVFTPFSLGTHTCLGAGFAELQLMMTFATIVHTADLALDPPDFTASVKPLPLPNPGQDFRLRVLRLREA